MQAWRPRDLGWLAAIVLVAACVRGGAFALAGPAELIGDELYYARVAESIARGEGHVFRDDFGAELRAWRPPGHPALLSLVIGDGSREAAQAPTRAVALQIALGALGVALAGWLGALLVDARTGLLAAALAAVHPNLVSYSLMLWSEPLVTAAIAALACGFAWNRARQSWAAALALGVGLGLAGLTRELAFAVGAVGALWWIAASAGPARRTACAQAALVLGLGALVVAPWTARNARALDRFVPVSTVGWFAAGEGQTFEHPDWLRPDGPAHHAYRVAYFGRSDEMARADFARAHALERFAAEQPAWLPRKIARDLGRLLAPDSYLGFKLRSGAYGEVSPGAQSAVAWLQGGAWLLAFGLGVAGLAALPDRRARALAAALLAIPLLLHLLTNSATRFRVPWLPLLLVGTSYALLRGRGLLGDLRGGARWVVIASWGFWLLVALPVYLSVGDRP